MARRNAAAEQQQMEDAISTAPETWQAYYSIPEHDQRSRVWHEWERVIDDAVLFGELEPLRTCFSQPKHRFLPVARTIFNASTALHHSKESGWREALPVRALMLKHVRNPTEPPAWSPLIAVTRVFDVLMNDCQFKFDDVASIFGLCIEFSEVCTVHTNTTKHDHML